MSKFSFCTIIDDETRIALNRLRRELTEEERCDG